MKSLLYIGYFILKTDYSDLAASLRCTARKGHSRVRLLADMLYCSIRYGSSFVDYFNFQFYRKPKSERVAYATMGYMYYFHQAVNAPDAVPLVDSKERFPENFGRFSNLSRTFAKTESDKLEAFLRERIGGKVVFKDPDSTAGKSVRIMEVSDSSRGLLLEGRLFEEFSREMFTHRQSVYLEDYIEQHEALASISPSGVNTIRVITMIEGSGDVRVLGAIFRISVNSTLDNFSAGNLAAEVDPNSGIVLTGGIRKRSSCDIYHDKHPVTGADIKDFQIPFWSEIMQCVREAAMIVPEVRSIGWDIAVTNNGPVIVEGNSKWNKDTWQIPAGRGKKAMIADYMN